MKKYILSLFVVLVLGFLITPLTTRAYSFQTNLNVGSRGADVVALQNILKERGFLTGTADGIFGRQTLAAVQKLQIANGFSSTSGAFGPLTRALLNGSTYNSTTTYPVGCTSSYGYSPTTGQKCDTVGATSTLPYGCVSTTGFSPTTGQACSSTSSTEVSNNQLGEWGNDVNGKHIGYLKSIYLKNDINYLTIDYVQWLSCDTDDCIQSIKVINNNPLIRTFPISKNVLIKLATYPDASGNYSLDQNLSLLKFKEALDYSLKNNLSHPYPPEVYYPKTILYWITIESGVVTEITEQFQA